LYAQIGLTRELAPFGITVNTVAPPASSSSSATPTSPDDVKKAYLASVPAGRMELPATSQTVSFLASEGAGFITGQRIVVHCGRGLGNRTPVHIPW
jgi:3-oxoacyl-[acyl-carrier protein] reductase